MSIYFVSEKGNQSAPIKIGTARFVGERLRSLQTSHHAELEILAVRPGGANEERSLHSKLSADRLRGEWFRRTAAVMAEVSASVGAETISLTNGLAVEADVLEARRLVLAIVDQMLGLSIWDRLSEAAELCRDCVSLSVGRLKTFYYEEARSVSTGELATLAAVSAMISEQTAAAVDLKYMPQVAAALEEAGVPLDERQHAIMTGHLAACRQVLGVPA